MYRRIAEELRQKIENGNWAAATSYLPNSSSGCPGSTITGEPLRLRSSVFRIDRNQFIYNLGDVPDDPGSAAA
jgi:hypothetical protein